MTLAEPRLVFGGAWTTITNTDPESKAFLCTADSQCCWGLKKSISVGLIGLCPLTFSMGGQQFLSRN